MAATSLSTRTGSFMRGADTPVSFPTPPSSSQSSKSVSPTPKLSLEQRITNLVQSLHKIDTDAESKGSAGGRLETLASSLNGYSPSPTKLKQSRYEMNSLKGDALAEHVINRIKQVVSVRSNLHFANSDLQTELGRIITAKALGKL